PRGSPDLGPLAVMVATEVDLKQLRSQLKLADPAGRPLFMSRVFHGQPPHPAAIVGPFMGAPYAVMLLENLIARGARRILFYGWCGSLCPDVRIGDVIIPTGAIVGDGTAGYYGADTGETVQPAAAITDRIGRRLSQSGCTLHRGRVFSTDAIYQETPNLLTKIRKAGAIGIEMEASALFTVGRFRGVDVGAVMVVSDNLSTDTWQTGFKDPRFLEARRAVHQGLAEQCQTP
ncbi:MAG: nucleoside phosphorylase, partial [Deltaproteobacteria bacterium]|nr:nucleoside phosphorylase [Deltaproteobacteria bacterium]